MFWESVGALVVVVAVGAWAAYRLQQCSPEQETSVTAEEFDIE